MEERPLGGSGVAVTRIVLGCGNFGGIGSSPAFFGQGTSKDDGVPAHGHRLGSRHHDLRHRRRVRRRAQRDAASASGSRRREADVRDRHRDRDEDVQPDGRRARITASGRARIRRQIETSLARLGVERVALYLAHDFDPDMPQEETLPAFDELVAPARSAPSARRTSPATSSPRRSRSPSSRASSRYEWVQNALLAARAGRRARPSSPSAGSTGSATTPLRPARRRLADRQVPPRRGATRRARG